MIKEVDYNDKLLIKEIKTFLNNNKYAEYTQDIDWFLIRNEEVKYYIYSKNTEGNIEWVCNLLQKEKNQEKLLYAPRGPVIDYENKELLSNFFKEIEVWLKEKGYKKLVINPCISYDILNNFPTYLNISITNNLDYQNLYDSCKLAMMDIIPNEEELLNKLTSKHRQNTRRSYRKGLTSKISKVVDYNNFYKLYLETAERHDFHPHNLDYFKKIVDIYKDNLIFLEVWYKDIPLAMSIDIVYKNKLIYLYGVSATSNRNLLGMYNMQWEAIKYAINNKLDIYDFGGVFCTEDDTLNKDYGLYNFKKEYCYKGFVDIVPDIVVTFE